MLQQLDISFRYIYEDTVPSQASCLSLGIWGWIKASITSCCTLDSWTGT